MNNQVISAVLHSLKKIGGALLRIILFVVAWCFKLSSRIIDKILKLSEK